MYVKASIDNSVEVFPYNLNDIKIDHPNTSFPRNINDEAFLSQFGIYKVYIEEKPSFDTNTQKLVQDASPTFADGSWTVGWTVENKTESELAQDVNILSFEARRLRNRYLSQSDWVVSYHTEKGTSIPQEWLDYRQALRDVTLQEGFPFDVVWPTIPE